MILVRVGRSTVAALQPPPFRYVRSTKLCSHGLYSQRSFSSSSTMTAESTSTTPVNALGSLTSELDKLAPRFELRPSQLTVLTTPDAFYSTLKDKILQAKERVFLSTLYIGKAEHELVGWVAAGEEASRLTSLPD
jgi:CDP-diacylglycerol---glycerol-3-phosphate 3-phosphatidyltransferase